MRTDAVRAQTHDCRPPHMLLGKRGVYRSIVDLQAAINRSLDETTDNQESVDWTAGPDQIIAAVKRGH